MSEMDPELDRRLALVREIAQPTGLEKQRLLAALRSSMHAPSAEPARVAQQRQPWAGWARPLVPWLGGGLIGASLTLVIWFGWVRASGGRDAAPLESGGGTAIAASREATRTADAVRVAVQVEGATSEEHASPLDLAEALEQLHRAERALHAAEPELTLAILSDLDRRARPSSLREERLTTRALALCQADRIAEALDARRQLEREFASSIYLRRLDQSCAVPSGPR